MLGRTVTLSKRLQGNRNPLPDLLIKMQTRSPMNHVVFLCHQSNQSHFINELISPCLAKGGWRRNIKWKSLVFVNILNPNRKWFDPGGTGLGRNSSLVPHSNCTWPTLLLSQNYHIQMPLLWHIDAPVARSTSYSPNQARLASFTSTPWNAVRQ